MTVSAVPEEPQFPVPDAGMPARLYGDFFARSRPSPHAVAAQVEQLHAAQQHEHVIALIEAALIHGQSQPWMYEVLALSMQIAGRPEAEVDRVVMSLADFGTADFGSLTFSAAYLVRLGRERTGLSLYREAARMSPEQPEPYVLGLRLARKLKDREALQWAACGVLQFAWTKDYPAQHREAENAAAEALAALTTAGAVEQVAKFQAELSAARQRDLAVRLVWSGPADLDLRVEEPGQSVCSFEQRETAGGGILLHEGCGPAPEECYEEYVCPLARNGEYRIIVRNSWGQAVGRRATLTITRRQGTAEPQVETQTLTLDGLETVVRVSLTDGRRTTPRPVAPASSTAFLPPKTPPRQIAPRGVIQPAALEYEQSRAQLEGFELRRSGAIGIQPVIQIIPDGATFAAQAVVSPDRRYVRIGVSPMFTNITDIFNFTFVGPGAGTTTGGPVPQN